MKELAECIYREPPGWSAEEVWGDRFSLGKSVFLKFLNNGKLSAEEAKAGGGSHAAEASERVLTAPVGELLPCMDGGMEGGSSMARGYF